MAFEGDFLEMFPHTVTVRHWVSEDSGGRVTYGDPVTYRAHVRDDVKSWRWQNGNEVQSRRTIYVSAETVGQKDEFTLPAGFEPRVMTPVYVIRRYDEDGYHHSEVYGA